MTTNISGKGLGMKAKDKIAKRFNVDPADLEYRNGQGWFYQGHLLHESLHELQHTPAWATGDIASLWIGDRPRCRPLADRIAEWNELAKKSWLIITVETVDHDAIFRHPDTNAPLCVPPKGHVGEIKPRAMRAMKRFRLQNDGFTTIDGEYVDHGFTVWYNNCQNKHYPEDAAFSHHFCSRGKFVTWDQFDQFFRAYVEMSNLRAQIGSGEYDSPRLAYNPHKNRIYTLYAVDIPALLALLAEQKKNMGLNGTEEEFRLKERGVMMAVRALGLGPAVNKAISVGTDASVS